jgi:GT2 family glycosyltransferase
MEIINKNQYESKITQSQKGLVSIIIPVYNGEHHLNELIENLVNQTYKKIEIITVDNNSTDNSLELLKVLSKEKTFLRIFSNKKNEGYCGGCNKGIENAYGEFLLFLSQDRIMNNDWIEKIVDEINKNEKTGCVIGKVEREGASSPEYGHSYDVYGAVLINGSPVESNLFFGGGTVLIRKKILDEIGGFDPEFFIYQEDVDICWRIRLSGNKIKIVENAICQNKGGGISDTFYDSDKFQIKFDSELVNVPIYKFYYSQKNRIRTMLKNYSMKNIWKRIPISIGMIFLRGIFMSVKNKNKSYVIAVFRGYFWNILNFNNTMKFRKEIQKNRIIDDDEIEKYMISNSIELEGIRMIIRNFIRKDEKKNV